MISDFTESTDSDSSGLSRDDIQQMMSIPAMGGGPFDPGWYNGS
jgi:hypothetical protein